MNQGPPTATGPSAPPPSPPELGAIRAVTFVVPDLAAIEFAYTTCLGARIVDRGAVTPAAATAWGSPAMAGCPTLVLAPEAGEPTWLRFVMDPRAGVTRAMTTHGWNATEFTVRDTDAMADRLRASPFTIVGAPRNLTGFPSIRAMQVLGPAGECLYLTDVGGDPSLAAPAAAVGQVFIAVAAGPDIAAMAGFYAGLFANPVSAPVRVPIGVVNRAQGLPPETAHGLALVTLPRGTRIELDEYPPATRPRATAPGHLPPGMAIVSFDVASLPERGDPAPPWLAPPASCDMAPLAGRLTACLRGGAGELVELCA